MGFDITTLATAKRIISNTKTDLTGTSIISALGYAPINSNKIGSAQGVASLDANGKVPTSQLPSYVNDVIEVNGIDNAPKTGESDKIYVDTITNRTYRWSGTSYVEISASDIVTASEINGNIKVNGSEINIYTHPSGTNPHGTTKSDIGLGNVNNTADADKEVKYAESATKATQDANGKVIAETYVKKSDNLNITKKSISSSAANTTTNIDSFSNGPSSYNLRLYYVSITGFPHYAWCYGGKLYPLFSTTGESTCDAFEITQEKGTYYVKYTFPNMPGATVTIYTF